jgi:hypothetical protein
MRKIKLIAAPVLALIAAGCIEPRITNTGRSAVEQNLLSHAVERAVDNMSFTAYSGQKAVIDIAKLAPQCDKDYVTAVIDTHMALSGIDVVEKPEDAKIKIHFYCSVLATDNTDFNIGTPAIPIPVPDTGISFGIPPLSIIKRVTRTGSCRMTAVISDAKTGKLIDAYRGVQSRTFFNHWVMLMFIPYVTRDVEVADTGTMTVEFMAE